MEIVCIALGFLLMAVGLVGCFIQRIPGPILTFIGVLLLQFGAELDMFDTLGLIICAVVIILSMIIGRFVPRLTTKISPFGKGGKWGTTLGSIIGVLVLWPMMPEAPVAIPLILGLVVVPFLAAYLGESIAHRSFSQSFRPTLGAYATYLVGTFLKLGTTIYCLYAAFSNLG